jgi:protein tyrosine/serine phosphatase
MPAKDARTEREPMARHDGGRPAVKLAALFLPWLLAALAPPRAAAQFPCAVLFPHDSNPTPITDEDICNFHKVDALVYRGGRPRPSAYPKLVELGVRTILDLEETASAEKERDSITRFNATLKPPDALGFISFPITQTQITRTGVSDEQIERLFHLLQEAPKPVFIHCYYGRDRTGAIVALYRMAAEGVSFDKAYAEALHYHFGPEDAGLLKTLERFRSPGRLSRLRAH